MYIDRDMLVGEIARELNIHISKDDPVFAVVILNQYVLTSVVDSLLSEIQTPITLAESKMISASTRLDKTLATAANTSRQINLQIRTLKWLSGITLAFILIGASVMSFKVFFTSHSTSLSADDFRYLANGKLMHEIWPKLDTQTQNKIHQVIREQKISPN